MIDLTNPSRPWWHEPMHRALTWSVKWIAGGTIAICVPLLALNVAGVI